LYTIVQQPSLIRPFTAPFSRVLCLPWQRRYRKHLQRMSDKYTGGSAIMTARGL